ncbi:MAG: class I SAM-dependent methyltransferase, partial [Desulfobacterales bacterium]
MASIREHYENHLAKYYSWMSGGLEKNIQENRKFFKDNHVWPRNSGIAVDLGAGSGFQSIPLAELGFRVVAIDLSKKLLSELKINAKDLPIEIIHDDLLNFSNHCPNKIELVVCMGDTLTHLSAHQTIRELFNKISNALEIGGRLILTFRDLTAELKGLDRFIPVRHDENNIFTCFLEVEKGHLKVHDIIYERTNNQWELKKSFFKKLVIVPQKTKDVLQEIGFKVLTFHIHNSLVCIIA